MRVLAGKYGAVFLARLKNLAEYRVNFWLKLVRPLIMTAAVGSLWMVLFRISGKDEIGGFTRESFIIYLLTIRFIAVFSPGGACIGEMNDEICSGNLTMRLVRPMHYLLWLFFRNLPVPLVSGVVGLVLVTCFATIIGAPTPTGWSALLFVVSVMATIATQSAIFQGLGILSFWVYDVFPMERFYRTVSGLLSGEMIPLTVFAPAVQGVLQFLPFASLAFIPGGIYTGIFSTKMAVMLVGSQYFWAVLLWTLVMRGYKRGLRKFEAQGG